MERPVNLSPIPRISTFHFPWSTGDHFYHLDQAIKMEKKDYDESSLGTNIQVENFPSIASISRSQAPRKIAMQLLRDSWSIFKDLKLGDWVKYVMGMPCAAISLFEAYHNELGLSIFSFLQQFPGDVDRIWEVTKVFLDRRISSMWLLSTDMQQSIQPVDRFLYTTLSHALIAVENKRPFHKLPIEAGHITGPLKELLGRPDKAIIRRLKILDARYARYKTGNNIAGGFKFEVETDFFTAVSELKAATIAWKMSEDALEGFGKINIHGLLFQDENLRRLAVQWDQINHNVEEIAAAGGLDDNLRDIAWVRTFFVSL